MNIIFEQIIAACEKHADPVRAPRMKAYMKDHFEYYGINSPLRKEISQDIKRQYQFQLDNDFWALIDLLWSADQRELQYIALDLMVPLAKKMGISDLPKIEHLITTKSWWDTVDSLTPNLVGSIFSRFETERDQYIYRWMDDQNIWLQRSAVIFQLKYGNKTDWNLLSEAILKNDISKEFFVRKGQGWALRQYSKYNPVAVRQFVEANPQLSGLTKREALRLLSKG